MHKNNFRSENAVKQKTSYSTLQFTFEYGEGMLCAFVSDSFEFLRSVTRLLKIFLSLFNERHTTQYYATRSLFSLIVEN